MKKKLVIVGVGGRTGTMFSYELRNSAQILGVAKEREVEMVKGKRLYIRRGEKRYLFEQEVIRDGQFDKDIEPDIIFLNTKNPVSGPIKYYFQKCKQNPPDLLISQNGIEAISDTQNALKEVLGKDFKRVRLIRIVLFNPIDKRASNDQVVIRYSLPIRIALSQVKGNGNIEDIVSLFEDAGFKTEVFPSLQVHSMEFSKLFLNLIGMASASRGLSIKQGFKKREVFREEVEVLREYIKAVRKKGGRFLNFSHYPVGVLSSLLSLLPLFFLMLLRESIAKVVSKGRGGKPKDLDEIDYYNGGVIDLGKKTGVETPVNERVYQRALKRLGS